MDADREGNGMRPTPLLLVLALAAACATGGAGRDFVVRDPRPADCEIEVLDVTFLPRPHVRLGEIRIPAESRDRDDVLPRLRREACKLGADAIIAVKVTPAPAVGGGGMAPGGGFGRWIWSAQAVGWVQPPATPAPR